ncbi:MAG: HEAT repeat domain-containing protein, partial [Gemmataceae bacterium]|nr:HEAT repeat domain-containing protein [Gemmataceae bacterium]
MNDEAAFVAAIAADPSDTHLPLIFADWLDDHDDPRGQWIRNRRIHEWMRPTYENPIPKLLESLAKDKRVLDVRRAAEVIGAPMVPGLVGLLTHEKPRVRAQACMCLRNIGTRAKYAVPALVEALSDGDSNVREQAAKALKDIGPVEGTDTGALKAALTDDNWNVRRAASKMLGSMKAKGSVLQELVEKFDSPDADDRKEVIQGLRELATADVVPVLDRALDDPEFTVRKEAVEALGGLRLPGVTEALCRAMKDPTSAVRLNAVAVLPRTPAAVAGLTALLSDPVPDVRAAACNRLTIAPDEFHAALIPPIIDLLDDLSPSVRYSAVVMLGKIGAGDESVLNALLSCLDAADPDHRRNAVESVGKVGKGNPAALAALLPRLADDNEGVVAAATGAVEAWGKLPASAVPAVLARVAHARATDPHGYTFSAALVPLAKFEPPVPPEVVDVLREAIRNPVGYSQTAAAEALGELGPDAAPAIPELLTLFPQSADDRLEYYWVQNATKALTRIGGVGLDELAAQFESPVRDTPWHIMDAIRYMGSEVLPLLPAVVKMFHRATDDWQRGKVAEAIRSFGAAGAASVPDLVAFVVADGPVGARVNTLGVLPTFGDAVAPHLPALIAACRR